MNLVILKCNLTRNVEMRYLQTGTAIGAFGVAVNRKWKDDQGNPKEEVSFFDVEAWGKTAETLSQWFSKGSPILITGRLKQETWDDKQTGQKRSKVKIVMDKFDFCGDTKAGGDSSVQPDAGAGPATARYGRPRAPVAVDDQEDAPF